MLEAKIGLARHRGLRRTVARLQQCHAASRDDLDRRARDTVTAVPAPLVAQFGPPWKSWSWIRGVADNTNLTASDAEARLAR